MTALLLSACGYHLRGGGAMSSTLKNIYLEGGSVAMREQFRKTMEMAAVPLASSPENASLIVRLFNEGNQRRVLALNSGGTANDFELAYRFDYDIVDSDNKVLMARQPVEIKREYYNDQLAIIAKGNEETLIRNEMYQQAVRTIVNRARFALKPSPQ